MLPEGFISMAASLPGLEVESFLNAMECDPSVGIRINPAKCPADMPAAGYAGAEPVEWCAQGWRLSGRPVFTLNPLLHAGAFYVQDPSSMIYAALAERALDSLGISGVSGAGLRVLDMCASPGGKTTAMLSRMPRGAVMVANEYTSARVGALRENLTKWGWGASIVCNSDTADFARCGRLFDIVAVDAPCSGEGMMRKDEDARSQWSEGLVSRCAVLQREILANAVECLRPGGILVYSTCTFNLEEDEHNASYIRNTLGLIPIDTGMTGIGGILPQLEGDIPCLRFMPHATRGEGLFAVMFRKPGDWLPADDDAPLSSARERKGKKGKNDKAVKGAAPLPDLSAWLGGDEPWVARQDRSGTLLEALPRTAAMLAERLERDVKIAGRGVTVAELKGKEWVPASELVLCSDYRQDAFPYVELSEEDALRYLRRESLTLPDVGKGYVAVGWRSVPLGMMKNIGNRANNLYPTRWKIKFL